jgi:hypothetical protein
MVRFPVAFLALVGLVVKPLDAQRPHVARFGVVVGFSPDPLTAAIGLGARYQIGPVLALSASAGHWFLNERCDALVGPCTPSSAWMVDAGATISFAAPARGWQPFATLRTGPVRFNYKPTTVWMASGGIGVAQTGRPVGLQLEIRYHSLFGGTSPPPDAVADRLMLYAGLVLAP